MQHPTLDPSTRASFPALVSFVRRPCEVYLPFRSCTGIREATSHQIARRAKTRHMTGYRATLNHDLSILLRFSRLFNRSTRFLCIFSSMSANRSRSAFAARFVLSASTRRWRFVSDRLHSRVEPPTCRSDSFSSFNSFSLALTAASAIRSAVRLSHEVWFDRGRKADLLSCHCFPVAQG